MFWRCEAVLYSVVLCCMKLYEVVQKCSKYQQFHLISSISAPGADACAVPVCPVCATGVPTAVGVPGATGVEAVTGTPTATGKVGALVDVKAAATASCNKNDRHGLLWCCYGAAMVLLWCCYGYYSCHCSGWGYTLRYTSGVRSITLHGPCIASIQSNNYYSWSHGTSKDNVFGLGFQSMDATSFKSWNVMELSAKHDTHIQIVSELYINNQPTLSMILYVCPLLPDSKASLESKELIQCLKTSIDVRQRYTKIMWYIVISREYVRRLCSRSMP